MGFLKRVIAERAKGGKPSAPVAFGVAVVAGVAAGVLVYRVLRSG